MRCTSSSSNQQGYVLVFTIAILALLTVAATFIGQRIGSSVELLRAEQDTVQRERALDSVQARVLYMLTTWPRVMEGLGDADTTVALDGRWYDAGSGVAVAFQDARGLIDINNASRDALERLLGTYGLDATRTGAAIDTLLDYRDDDSLRRLQGAEKDDYLAAGYPPPRNADLIAPPELKRVFGWKAEPELWGADGILEHVVVGNTVGSVNPNTATWRTLVAMYGLSADTARALVNQRRTATVWTDMTPFVTGGASNDPFAAAVGVAFPSSKIVVTLSPRGAQWAYRYALTLTPQSSVSGWRIDYAYRIAFDSRALPAKLPVLPDVLKVPERGTAADSPLPF